MMAIMDLGPDVSGPINVGNPHEVTMLELAQAIIDLVGNSAELEFFDIPQDDPTRRCPDISLMKSLTGWEPRFPLQAGLIETIEDFRKRLEFGHSVRAAQIG
jgi:UDP-glucuronate decarboxylase